jgi:hypothetical protein
MALTLADAKVKDKISNWNDLNLGDAEFKVEH